jgi:hypothetical protein
LGLKDSRCNMMSIIHMMFFNFLIFFDCTIQTIFKHLFTFSLEHHQSFHTSTSSMRLKRISIKFLLRNRIEIVCWLINLFLSINLSFAMTQFSSAFTAVEWDFCSLSSLFKVFSAHCDMNKTQQHSNEHIILCYFDIHKAYQALKFVDIKILLRSGMYSNLF